jgi:hypothetical protein
LIASGNGTEHLCSITPPLPFLNIYWCQYLKISHKIVSVLGVGCSSSGEFGPNIEVGPEKKVNAEGESEGWTTDHPLLE